ncbi:hypothetical protein [Kitasatospora viridis]|uniref:Uncharacterized protein n=1 Tax=Kitasatospora viridis TaxID=281105 RepID=A0A561UC45_9ACTN|nr:hypothetical protein [Kitasatospora viridis]TWF96934.1 hypothetical protein FHX73_11708 [Kitasatospora viridis]
MPARKFPLRGARLAAAITAGAALGAAVLTLTLPDADAHATATDHRGPAATMTAPSAGVSAPTANPTASASPTTPPSALAAPPGLPSPSATPTAHPAAPDLPTGAAAPVRTGTPIVPPAGAPSSAPPLPVPGQPQTQVLSAELDGFPATLSAGGQPVEFTAVLSNPTATAYPSVAPLFQLVGGPCNCSDGSLQLLDPATGAWQNVTMPTGDGGSPASFATGGAALPAHGSLTFHFRLTLSTRNSAEDAFAMLYAIDTADQRELALSSTPSRIG